MAKKYASFKDDFAKFLEELKIHPLQGSELYPGIRKIRMQIKSKGKGKSGGARVITYNILINDLDGDIVLLYDKDIASTVDMNIVKEIIETDNTFEL